MKIGIYIAAVLTLIISIISCKAENDENIQNIQNIQTNKIANDNKIYINPMTTNSNKDKNILEDKTMGTKLDPLPTGYQKIDDILNDNQYKIMIYEISKLIAEKGIEGTLEENIQPENSYEIIAYKDSTPLFLAVQYGYYDLAEKLIKEGANINARASDLETEDGIDMLYYAS